MTIDRWITDAAIKTPDKAAIIFGDEIIDYKTMALRISERTEQLRDANISHGDRLSWYGLSNPEVFILLFACARIGAIFVPLNWRLAEKEVAAIIANCSPKLLIYDSNFEEQARVMPDVRAIPFGANFPIIENTGPIVEANEDDALLIVYTSGSTGLPKGVVLTQTALICNAMMSVDAHRMNSDDVVLNVLPLFHVGGLNILPTPAFSIGATVRLHEKFDPERVCEDLQHSTLAITVPTVLQQILNTNCWANSDLSNLRGLSIGSTDVPISLIEAVHSRGIPMIQIYGATETSPCAIYQTLDDAFESVGSIGRVGKGCDIRLVSDGQDVPLGEPGEIWVKGDNVLIEYWRDPELTETQLLDGWLSTGDIASLDQQGYYWFTDRIKNVIISGGENIFPAEIERILRDQSGIKEVTVVGRPDTKWGEIPVAVVVAETPMTKDDVLAPLQANLARFKHPKDVVFVDALPRNATGKVVVQKVKELITQ